jgi:hypothetical protein
MRQTSLRKDQGISKMIRMRQASQYSFGDGPIAGQTGELWEPCIRQKWPCEAARE